MSDVSFAILGILLMLDICFVTNFFVIRALRNFVNANTGADATRLSDNVEPTIVKLKANCFESFLFGYVLGKVKPDPLNPQRFPDWNPIPYKFGVVVTCTIVLTALALLSPKFLMNKLGLNIGLSGDLCNAEDKAAGLIELRAEIKSLTNFDDAAMQWEHMNNIYSALQNDTTLYGTRGYTCKTLPGNDNKLVLDGTKAQWTNMAVDPAATYGTYFPGYCFAYHSESIDIAATKTCGPTTLCACPTFPRKQPWKFIGWAGKKMCLAKVCFTFDFIPCGEVSLDAQAALENYRAQQLSYAAERQDIAMDDVEYPDVSNAISTGAAETFTKLLYQFDIASNVYAVYSCLALLFPVPLDVFRFPHSVAVRNFTFGAQKGYFILGVVAIWWGYSYIQTVLYSYEVQLFFANLLAGDPCYLDGNYIVARQDILHDLCQQLLPMEPEFSKASITASAIIAEVRNFKDRCGCAYPMVDLYPFRDTNGYTKEIYEPLGFGSLFRNCAKHKYDTNCQVYLPEDGIVFLGNSSLCEDTDYARELLLQAPETEVSLYQMWLQSGLLATLLIKFAMTNFAVGLLKLADPFVVCNGHFMWIPAKFGLGLHGVDKTGLFEQFKKTKETALFNITLRTLVVWGLLLHFCLYSLMFAAYSGSSSTQSVNSDDIAVLLICLGISIFVVLAALSFMVQLKKRLVGPEGHGHIDDFDDEY